MNETHPVKLNKDAESLLNHIFYDRIITLGSKTKDGGTISIEKQIELKRMKDTVLTFVERNVDSEFDIRILHKETEDKENFRVSLTFRNFKEQPENRVNKYMIVLDHSLSSVTFYQWAINNVLIFIK